MLFSLISSQHVQDQNKGIDTWFFVLDCVIVLDNLYLFLLVIYNYKPVFLIIIKYIMHYVTVKSNELNVNSIKRNNLRESVKSFYFFE